MRLVDGEVDYPELKATKPDEASAQSD